MDQPYLNYIQEVITKEEIVIEALREAARNSDSPNKASLLRAEAKGREQIVLGSMKLVGANV